MGLLTFFKLTGEEKYFEVTNLRVDKYTVLDNVSAGPVANSFKGP